MAVALEGATEAEELCCRFGDAEVFRQRDMQVVLLFGLGNLLGELCPVGFRTDHDAVGSLYAGRYLQRHAIGLRP